jgi:hypothetical protein
MADVATVNHLVVIGIVVYFLYGVHRGNLAQFKSR